MQAAMDYNYYKSCCTEDLPQRIKDERWAWADRYLIKDLQWWKLVRWSDEYHCGFGGEGQLWIIRRRGAAMRDTTIFSTKISLQKSNLSQKYMVGLLSAGILSPG
jgi:hypothetical protein